MKTGGISSKQPETGEQAKLISQRHLSLADASEHASLQSWLPIDFQQLSPGSFVGSYQELAFGEQLLVRESQNQAVHKRGVMAPGMCTVSFQRSIGPLSRFGEFEGKPLSQLFLLPAGTEFDVQAADGCEIVYVRFDQQRLFEAARTIDEVRWSRVPDELTAVLSAGCERLGGFFDELFRMMTQRRQQGGLPDSDRISSLILDNVLLALDQSTALISGDAPDYRSRRRALRMVYGVRDYIDASLERGNCPSIVEICAHAGVSQRSLQYGFQELLQMTPVAYLRILRLNRVRVELCAPSHGSQTVTETATRWGFFHLGKFAGDYRQMFGELPSETLRLASTRIYSFA